ncbi:MAG: methyltransferase domain-containing protein [Thermoanaerobaculia bacterium]|nr:methyltransferase domain-containing protein [Thermoanaerobaculia bacterium]
MTARDDAFYVHALRFRWLTPLYDGVVAATTRERTFRAAVLEQAGLRPGQRVLDLGCGTGTLAIEMASRCPGLQIFGLDGDPEVLSRAERKAVRAGVEITWQQGLATRLPFPDGSFDRAVSTLFFHHLATEDKVSAARELHRVLRPGGQLHVADWGPPASRFQRLLFLPVQLLDGFANTSAQLAGGLADAFRQAGFEGVEVTRRIRTPLGTMALHSATRV